MKKVLLMLMALLVAGSMLFAQGGKEESASNGGSKPQIVLRYGDVNPLGHVLLDSAQYFAQQVSEMSNGRIKIEIYPSGQLGDDNEVYQAMQMGAVDLYRGNASSMSDFGKMQVTALALPYIFRDRDHFWSVCSGDLGKEILADIQASGSRMVGLFYMDEGARNFFTTDAPVTKLADLKNLKIRVQNSQLMLDTVSALGANPTPIDYAELYTALQTGVVDGAENPPASYFSNKFYEVAPYYVLDGHTYSPSVVLMSEIVWNRLSSEDQQILVKAGQLTEEFNRKAIEAADQKAYDNLRKAGVQITTLSDPEKWSDCMAPVYAKHGSAYIETINKVKAVK
ncbi:MAG: TRAP transporter substrate-binding protein [Sphaerochaeta sp.]|jgi:tripartite ATP-independent transporter DctP family solute receptor|uniref:TRAP transporter substrate-binding protein n=1 Tax=Sphaerochaeta sp. TaxID=1972642 RepID=UPI002FCC98CC